MPRISIQAFCETSRVAEVIESAAMDRRMLKAHMKVHMGGVAAAIEAFRGAPTPNLIVIESVADRAGLIASLDELSEFCDSGTKVIVVGHENDIALYRMLTARGVSDYIVAPFEVLSFIQHVSHLYNGPNAETLGRVIAVVGAKGGVGASNISHNLAWSISRVLEIQSVVADLDLAFGTAGLDFNQDPPQGIAEVVFSPERVDANLIDRLLSKCSDTLEPARGARDAGSPLRSAGVRLRSAARHSARLDALHGARHAASMDGLDPPHSDERRRRGDRRQSRSRQSAQRQDAGRRTAFGAAQRSSSEAAAQ